MITYLKPGIKYNENRSSNHSEGNKSFNKVTDNVFFELPGR